MDVAYKHVKKKPVYFFKSESLKSPRLLFMQSHHRWKLWHYLPIPLRKEMMFTSDVFFNYLTTVTYVNCTGYNFMCYTKKEKKVGFVLFFFLYLSSHFLWYIHCQPNSIHVLLNYINNNCIFNNVITNFILIKYTIYISFIIMIVYWL